ncbi:MAG TPA: dihydrofolate reductase [Cyclobacteriaceae bacterium]
MKVILIANISANGKVLLSENANHQPPQEAINFYVQKVIDAGSLIIGRKTFEIIQQFPGGIKQIFQGTEIVLLSNADEPGRELKVMDTPEKAIRYLAGKGFTETVIGGGTQTYNAFLNQGLITEMYLNIIPVITGNGGIIGTNDELFTAFKLSEYKALSDSIVQLHLSKQE